LPTNWFHRLVAAVRSTRRAIAAPLHRRVPNGLTGSHKPLLPAARLPALVLLNPFVVIRDLHDVEEHLVERGHLLLMSRP